MTDLKFVQIAVGKDGLYGLDENGQVWCRVYDRDHGTRFIGWKPHQMNQAPQYNPEAEKYTRV